MDDIGRIVLPTLTTAVQTAFKTGQEPIIVPQTAYNTVYGTAVSDTLGANLSRISDNWLTYNPLQDSLSGTIAGSPVTLDLQPKTIIEDWTMNWGRMNALLGTEVPHTTMINQTSIPQAYIDPPTELVKLSPDDGAPITGTLADGTQLWKITHNGVDSHAVHFHLFHVQLVNRVGWDGAVRAPDANELGWKDTVRMNPLEDVIVALRPKTMTLPFKVPNSHRILDPSHIADNNPAEFFNLDPTSGNASNVTNTNVTTNFGWEYLWHCHILGHEENDMMRAIAVAQAPEAPTAISATGTGTAVTIKWTDNSVVSNWAQIQRDTVSTFDSANLKTINVVEPECAVQAGCERSYVDNTVPAATSVYYRVMANNTVGGGDARADVPRNPDGSYGSILPAELTSLTPGFTGYANATANSAWSGTVSRLAIPTANVTSGPLAFGNQLINTTSTAKTVTVINTGTGNLAISGVALATGSQFGITHNCQATLAPAAKCTIDVTFKPTVAGALADTLTIIDNSNGIAGSKQTVALSGTGTAAPIANVLPAGPLTFGNVYVGTTSAAQKVTLSNSGTLPLAIASIVASAPYAQTNNCPATLAAGSNCAISVTFKPTSAVTSYGLLTITDNSNGVAGSKQTVALSGTGLPAGPVLNLVAVTNLTAQVNAANVMQLYWTDRSTLETGYRIQRCTGSIATTCAPLGGGWANVTAGIWPSGALTSPTNGLITATITATLAQNTISYRVYPLSGATVGPVSNTVSVNLAANPAAPSTVRATAGVGKVALTWIDVANNNTQYRFRSRYATAFNANGTVRTWSAWSNVTVNPAIGPNVQAATLSAAQIGATYKAGRTFQFQVGASNQAGTSYATASTNVVVR